MGIGARRLIDLRRRVEDVRRRMEASERASGRRPGDVTLIAVSKTHPASLAEEAIDAGVTDLGENRVQEAEEKITTVGKGRARWHLIGHLQANKARRAVLLFDVLHSLDSTGLARRLDRMCAEEERARFPVLIQVDLGGEATKTGASESELPALADEVRASERLDLIGLMTLPPFFDDAERARPYFRRLRELRDKLKAEGNFGDSAGHLSMGMTHDFEVAISEGATMVRVGTAIFGPRPAG